MWFVNNNRASKLDSLVSVQICWRFQYFLTMTLYCYLIIMSCIKPRFIQYVLNNNYWSNSDSIDGEIKSVTKNSNTKTWTFSLLGVLGKYTENSKFSLSLALLKIVTLFISPLSELHALSLYKPLI